MCVATRPAAIEGQGGNATTFGVACLLVWGFGLEPDEALPLMMEYNNRCEPPWTVRELERMLVNVKHKSHREARGHLVGDGDHEKGVAAVMEAAKPRRRVKKHVLELIKAAQAPGLPADMAAWRPWLVARSPIDPRLVGPEAFLDALYEPGELVLIFNRMWGTQGDFGREIGRRTFALPQTPDGRPTLVERLPEGSPEGMTWLMQPVDGKWKRKHGDTELSRRTKQNVTRWPYILLESDQVPHELWLNIMVRARLRIVAIIASGGRSLHALVKLGKESEQALLDEVKDPDNEDLLVMMGCDPQALHGMVSPRLPNTWREGKRVGKLDRDGKPVFTTNGRGEKKRVMEFVPFRYGPAKQALLYFNPAAERGRCVTEGLLYEHN